MHCSASYLVFAFDQIWTLVSTRVTSRNKVIVLPVPMINLKWMTNQLFSSLKDNATVCSIFGSYVSNSNNNNNNNTSLGLTCRGSLSAGLICRWMCRGVYFYLHINCKEVESQCVCKFWVGEGKWKRIVVFNL